MEDIEINYYNTVNDSSNTFISSFCYGYNCHRVRTNFKEEIGIILTAHLIQHKVNLLKGNINSLIEELNDTIIHELIHNIGNCHNEYYVIKTAEVMLFSPTTIKWMVDLE